MGAATALADVQWIVAMLALGTRGSTHAVGQSSSDSEGRSQ